MNPMDIDFNKYVYIACVPVSLSQNPPSGQKYCKKQPCQCCNELMWISIAKRQMIKDKPEAYKCVCMYCLFIAAKLKGMKEEDFHMIDIKKHIN